jgi:Domain of unknown function (DUF5076)
MSQPDEYKLNTPDSVAADPEAVEFTRMWWSNGEPVMSIKPAFNDPRQYGEMLAIAARHMAHGYAVRHGHNERQAYNLILQGLSDVIKADNVQTVAVPSQKPGAAR